MTISATKIVPNNYFVCVTGNTKAFLASYEIVYQGLPNGLLVLLTTMVVLNTHELKITHVSGQVFSSTCIQSYVCFHGK